MVNDEKTNRHSAGGIFDPAAGLGHPPGYGKEPEENIAGSDWRTWGIIDDYGTLVRDGETIAFCACVHTQDTTLYYDTESQVLLAELVYPAPVENAEQRYLGMDTADRNGDGSSDVLLRFSQKEGTLELLFCWDPETGTFRSVLA